MAKLRDTLRVLLENDAALTTLLTGGVWDSSELPRERITAANVPSLFEANGVTLKPFAALTWRGETPLELLLPESQRQLAELYVYQHAGYGVINDVLARVAAMFAPYASRQVEADDATAWVRWAGNLGDLTDPNLQGASMNRALLELTIVRK